jgi:hypothetical protein
MVIKEQNDRQNPQKMENLRPWDEPTVPEECIGAFVIVFGTLCWRPSQHKPSDKLMAYFLEVSVQLQLPRQIDAKHQMNHKTSLQL